MVRKTTTLVTVGIFLSGCFTGRIQLQDSSQTIVQARYTKIPIVIDGSLDDLVWKNAEEYILQLPREKLKGGMYLQETGAVKFAWDDQYFYVGIRFEDSDVVAEGAQDQLMLYELGDVAELFLKPDSSTWYWELYVSPNGKKTNIWFPGRGRLFLPSCLTNNSNLRVAAQVNGSLNDWTDKDFGWTAEMAMPIKELTYYGDSFGMGSKWRLLIGRYNYSRYSKWLGAELSSVPQLNKANYHSLEEYAVLEFIQ